MSGFSHFSPRLRLVPAAIAFLTLLGWPAESGARSAYVRVNQIGYEAGSCPFRAYLISSVPEFGATFTVASSHGNVVYSAAVGALLGTWSHNKTWTYNVYGIDFSVPGGDTYTISVFGPMAATSPRFPVDKAAVLYPGLLLNTLFSYETERDGPDYIANTLRSAPGHLNDESALAYETPALNSNDLIDTTGTPLNATGQVIDASGGWWDAGDYMKYVETTSYTVALLEIGIRDFPNQMGPNAPLNPPAPPDSISYAGRTSEAPASSDFTAKARFGINFLRRMWDNATRTLYYQVGNSQDWQNFSNLLSDYDIWRLPQADDTWDDHNDDAQYIRHRPAFVAGPPGSPISPNLAGRLTADFAVCCGREDWLAIQTSGPAFRETG